MRVITSFAAAAITALVTVGPLAAQTITTIGGTTNAPSGANRGKGNAITVSKSVLLLDFQFYLNVPGAETLTFWVYRFHSPKGTFKLMNSWQVKVNGTGTGATWYSSGKTPTLLLAGNSYILGVSWSGTVTYHYNRATCGQAFALGNYLSGSTVTNPPGATEVVGCDIAMYYQRFTSLPSTSVVNVGTGCGSSIAPRLLAVTPPAVGTKLNLALVDTTASSPAALLLSPLPTVKSPIQLWGCSIWLNLAAPTLVLITPQSSAGLWRFPIPIPAGSAYAGVRVSAQAAVTAASQMHISNAVDLWTY